jgi:hypothetical protein
MERRFPRARADAVVKELELNLDCGICHACLSFVSFALDGGDSAVGEIRRMTPVIWDEGLAEHALAAVRLACDRDVPYAAVALADLELNGGRSATARSIVRHLAEALSRRSRTELHLLSIARGPSPPARPEWN